MATTEFRPERVHEALGPEFFDPVRPAAFPEARLRFRNDRWAERIGLGGLDDAAWVRALRPLRAAARRLRPSRWRCATTATSSGSTTPRSATAAASSSPSCATSPDGRLLDLGTKGSGTTPWSRTGDGRLTLKGGVREVLATEMLEALGVYTSKTLQPDRDRRGADPRRRALAHPLVGAGPALSHSHIRIGTFQRLAALRRAPTRSAGWSSTRSRTSGPTRRARPTRSPGSTTRSSAPARRLGAEWFAAGFVHGVLNTDNINVTGESFDYGPWRFLDRFDPAFTAAYFDQTGLYCFARQPEALNWNLARLGECLIPISSREAIEPVFDSFADRFQTELARQTFARLGLLPGEPEAARALMHRFWATMQETAPPFQRVFFDLLGGGLPERLRASPLLSALRDRRLGGGDRGPARPAAGPGARARRSPTRRPPTTGPETMVIEEVEAIWAAIDRDDDWEPARRQDRPRPPRWAPSTPPSACSPARTPARGTSPIA